MTPDVLQNRLVDFGLAACRESRHLPRDFAGVHISRQLIRAATAVAANYAEARSAESGRDFVHKMQVCLKELREAAVWLKFARMLRLRAGDRDSTLQECGELIAIFVASIQTTKKRQGVAPAAGQPLAGESLIGDR